VSEASLATLSPLDCERFGVVVARADDVTAEVVPALLSFCERKEVDLLIARCAGGDLEARRALAAAGLRQFEAQIVLRGGFGSMSPVAGIREATPEDAAAVAELAGISFGDYPGHYHADPRLSLEACRETYVDWAMRGLSGEAADIFFVAEVEGRPAGFVMLSRKGDEMRSILTTVAPSARGKGLYPSLLTTGMAWGFECGARNLVAITQHHNIAVQRTLGRLGLAPVGSTSTFHGWRDQLEVARSARSRESEPAQ
jgi:RimJ/RimL family protein N-acetyltransferase